MMTSLGFIIVQASLRNGKMNSMKKYHTLDCNAKRLWLLDYHKNVKPIPPNLLRYVEFEKISEFTLDVVYKKVAL